MVKFSQILKSHLIMATSLLRRTDTIFHNARRLNLRLLTQHFPMEKAVNDDVMHRVPKAVSFYSHMATAGGGGGGLPSFMRGTVFWESGKPLSIEDFHMPRPKAGEVLVKTKGSLPHPLFLPILSLFIHSHFFKS